MEDSVKDKIKVAFIYKPSNPFLTPDYYDTTNYNFFWLALKRNPEIEISYFASEGDFDTSQLKNKFDIILIPSNYHNATPNLIGINKLEIPVICKSSDPHYAKKLGIFQDEYHEKFKIDHYWGWMPERYWHEFYPKDYKYEAIVFGIESDLFNNLKPFQDRIKDKIVNTGQIGNKKLKSRIANKILNPRSNGWYFYKLRTLCNDLPYVVKQTLGGKGPALKQEKFTGNNYYQFLSKYRAGIAATTFYPTAKYWEIPAAGCLTFMEITNRNYGEHLEFRDKKTAIFINEKNYKDKFQEYLENPDDSEWEKIAMQGRKYVLNEFCNDKATKKLIKIMRKLI
jgi:hypothetical protein